MPRHSNADGHAGVTFDPDLLVEPLRHLRPACRRLSLGNRTYVREGGRTYPSPADIRQDASRPSRREPPDVRLGSIRFRPWGDRVRGVRIDTRDRGRRAAPQPGDVVAIREIWNGRVWYARPATVVRDDAEPHDAPRPAARPCKEPVDGDGTPAADPDRPTGRLSDTQRGETWNAVVRVPRHAVCGDPGLRRRAALCASTT